MQKIAEGEAFATAIGADFIALDHSDGFLPDTDEVALELATIIREKQPDTVITHWKHSIHRDHEHAAKLAGRARFLAGLPMDHELPRHEVYLPARGEEVQKSPNSPVPSEVASKVHDLVLLSGDAMSGAVRQLSGPAGLRRSPTRLVHDVAIRYARLDSDDATGGGPVRQLCNGIAVVRDQTSAYADFWREHNRQALTAGGPLWVVLGDSTAQGIGASSPLHGYVGQAYDELMRLTGRPWRLVNLSRSGAVASEVLTRQLPRVAELPTPADLVTCGIGSNDILCTPPWKVHATLRALIAELPDCAAVLDLPLPVGVWGIGGVWAPYVARVNRTIHTAAEARSLPVAEVSRHFTPPWEGKFAGDKTHPSDLGYRDMARALIASIAPD